MESKRSGRRQVKIYLSENQYEILKKRADELGISVPALVKDIVLESIGESQGSILSRIKELEEKCSQLADEVGRIEQKLAILSKKINRGLAYERV